MSGGQRAGDIAGGNGEVRQPRTVAAESARGLVVCIGEHHDAGEVVRAAEHIGAVEQRHVGREPLVRERTAGQTIGGGGAGQALRSRRAGRGERVERKGHSFDRLTRREDGVRLDVPDGAHADFEPPL